MSMVKSDKVYAVANFFGWSMVAISHELEAQSVVRFEGQELTLASKLDELANILMDEYDAAMSDIPGWIEIDVSLTLETFQMIQAVSAISASAVFILYLHLLNWSLILYTQKIEDSLALELPLREGYEENKPLIAAIQQMITLAISEHQREVSDDLVLALEDKASTMFQRWRHQMDMYLGSSIEDI